MQRSPISSVPDESQVYQPREDTFLLLSGTSEELRPGDRFLEVGTGSGYISSHLPSNRLMVATEINPHAALVSTRAGVNVIRTDLLSGIRCCFDLVIFNPPYLPTKPGERIPDWLEYALDGGEDGLVVIRRFLRDVRGILSRNGRILLLVSSLNGFTVSCDLFSEAGFEAECRAEEKTEDGEVLRVYRLVLKTPL